MSQLVYENLLNMNNKISYYYM